MFEAYYIINNKIGLMKILKTVLGLLLCVISITAVYAKSNNQKTNKIFVGTWSGFEKSQQIQGIETHWIQHRFEDGTYIILFIDIDENGEVHRNVEKGKWWIDKNEFHEKSNSAKEPDSYTFEIINEQQIRFKALKVRYNPDYTFIDVKMEE